jgi:Cu(I)/Ag(I) efflux system membrane fusion protein
MVESARRRFELWNINAEQIAELEQSRAARDTLTLHSPFKGVVQQLSVAQGSRVAVGDSLVGVADLSTVWVWAEFYQDELPLVKRDARVTVTSSSIPEREFKGKIAVVDPFINETTRTGRARLEVENPGLQLQPQMYVNVSLEADSGEALVVPATAVMPTGDRNLVFVDKGGGTLEPRFVELGTKYGTNYLVSRGLRESDRVVNSANFLIDAEARVQGAVKHW